MTQWVGQRSQVALLIIVKLPTFAGRQYTFDKLSMLVITVSKGIAGWQFHFGQCTVRVVIKGSHLPQRVAFPHQQAVTPLTAGNTPQWINFPYHQSVRVVVVVGFTPFAIQIGGNAGVVIIAETVMPVAAGRGGAEYPTALVIGYRQVSLVGIMPADHPPLHIIFMPQVVVLESITLVQIAL